MTKKNTVTTELTNIFPPWSRVRKDDVSVGFRMLNAIANPMQTMHEQLLDQRKNQYLTTANLDEIDITHKVILPREFEFEYDTTDPLLTSPVAPTVSGVYNDVWYTISVAENNDIQTFWYDVSPTRLEIPTAYSGLDDSLVTFNAEDTPQSGIWKHHLADTELNGGYLWVEATGGVQYLTQASDGSINRGRVRLVGVTRKGTREEEILIFPWDQKQRTQKEWEKILEINTFDIEDGVQIDIRSSDMQAGPYQSFYNLRFSKNRNKVDEFWDLGFDDGIPTIDRIEYTADEWQQLIVGFSGRSVQQRWELLEDTDNIVSGINISVSGVDMAIQPFTERAWIVTEDAKLYLYDLREDMPSGIQKLRGVTAGPDIQIEVDTPQVVLGEEIEFLPWHARPLKEILSYKLWYQMPDGTKYNLVNGSPVPFDSSIKTKITEGTPITRNVSNYQKITATQRGTYLFVFEATYVDGEIHTYKTLITVNYKTPLASFDVSNTVSGIVEGIEFDSDQKLWIRTTDADYYQIDPHYDVMLVDYDRKIVYFHEEYNEVHISND